MTTVNPEEYTQLPYVVYDSLSNKLQALFNGETLYLKDFERKFNSDVIVRLHQGKFTLTQMSYDLQESDWNPRYWRTFNLGINDLSLFTTLRFEEWINQYSHKYQINDVVSYISSDGRRDTAVIKEIYVNDNDSNFYAYTLSRDGGLYAEEDLFDHQYR